MSGQRTTSGVHIHFLSYDNRDPFVEIHGRIGWAREIKPR